MTKNEIGLILYDILEEREGNVQDQVDGVLEFLIEENLIEEEDEDAEEENE